MNNPGVVRQAPFPPRARRLILCGVGTSGSSTARIAELSSAWKRHLSWGQAPKASIHSYSTSW